MVWTACLASLSFSKKSLLGYHRFTRPARNAQTLSSVGLGHMQHTLTASVLSRPPVAAKTGYCHRTSPMLARALLMRRGLLAVPRRAAAPTLARATPSSSASASSYSSHSLSIHVGRGGVARRRCPPMGSPAAAAVGAESSSSQEQAPLKEPATSPAAAEVTAAAAAVAAAGESVRALKAAGATNADEAVQAGVATLKALKAELAALEKRASGGDDNDAPKLKPKQQKKKPRGERDGTRGGVLEKGLGSRAIDPSKLYVGDLGDSVDDDALRAMFAPHGQVLETNIVRNPDGTSRGFGFVRFATPEAAAGACTAMHAAQVGGGSITVKVAGTDKSADAWRTLRPTRQADTVRLYKCNPVETHSVKAPGFNNPCT
jgi:hypothetical protein